MYGEPYMDPALTRSCPSLRYRSVSSVNGWNIEIQADNCCMGIAVIWLILLMLADSVRVTPVPFRAY